MRRSKGDGTEQKQTNTHTHTADKKKGDRGGDARAAADPHRRHTCKAHARACAVQRSRGELRRKEQLKRRKQQQQHHREELRRARDETGK